MIFVHINRTGGTSIEAALGLKHEHRLAEEYTDEEWNAAGFRFTFVRNPFDRVVSTYLYQMQSGQIVPVTFSEYIHRCYVDKDPAVRTDWRMSGLHSPSWAERYFSPCMYWIGSREFDVIGRFEKLESHFAAIIGPRRPRALPWSRKSVDRLPYQAYYDVESRRIIQSVFEPDLDTFEYLF